MLATAVGMLVVAAAPMTSANSSTIDGLASPDDPAPAVRLAPPKKQEPPPPPPSAPVLSADYQRQLELVNAERSRHGLPPMIYDLKLEQAAQGHSQDQANRRTMTHRGADGSNTGDRLRRVGYSFRNWAENVAFGYGSVDAVMIAWMGSSGHARNILSSNTHIGFGLAYSADGLPYYTQVFATPRG